MALNSVGAFSRMSPALSAAYSSLTKSAPQRAMSNPKMRSLGLTAGQRQSAAVQDLAMQSGTEDLTPEALDEQRKKKQLLDAQRSGIMSAAWLSLSGNQF